MNKPLPHGSFIHEGVLLVPTGRWGWLETRTLPPLEEYETDDDWLARLATEFAGRPVCVEWAGCGTRRLVAGPFTMLVGTTCVIRRDSKALRDEMYDSYFPRRSET